jgi:uncharacterized membrane protein HdeD (DUF308 family)
MGTSGAIDPDAGVGGPPEADAVGGDAPSDTPPRAVSANVPWWLFVLTGLVWVLIGAYVLALRPGSAALVLALITASLFVVGVLEIIQAFSVASLRWLHGLFGVAMLLGAGYSIYAPRATILVAAWVLAWYLLASGIMHIIQGFMARSRVSGWWVLLILGALEALIGVWAIVEPERTLVLLLVWAGIAALSRGIGDFLTAYALRSERIPV